MDANDKINILNLRKITGCPLPLVKEIYLKHQNSSTQEAAIAELKTERKKLFDKIRQRETEKTIFLCKEEVNVIKVLKCQMQTDYLARTAEMQEIFHALLNGDTDISDSYERLVVYANENCQYHLYTIPYSKYATCSFHTGIWSDLTIKGLTVAESLIIIQHDAEGNANMVASKIFKYISSLEEKIELNEQTLASIFDERIISKFHELKLTDYQVFF